MTKVKCDVKNCIDLKDGVCQADEIELNSHGKTYLSRKTCSRERWEW